MNIKQMYYENKQCDGNENMRNIVNAKDLLLYYCNNIIVIQFKMNKVM